MSFAKASRVWLAAFVAITVTVFSASTATAAELVVNGDFSQDVEGFVTWPGYVANGDNPTEVPFWPGTGGRGINPIQAEHGTPAPFRDNGDNDTLVAFMQNAAEITQDVTGFTVGDEYLLTLDYNARDCCTNFPEPTLAIGGELFQDYPDPNLFPDGIVTPVGDLNPWYHYEGIFVAEQETLKLTISSASSKGVQDFSFVVDNVSITPSSPPTIDGGGETYFQDFDVMGVATGRVLPQGWRALEGNQIDGLGLTDGFLTVPGSQDDGVLGVLNLGGNTDSFGPAPDGFIPTWTAELGGANNLFGRDDVIADNASDRALGMGRENNDHAGEIDFEIEIAENSLRAFVVDWDLEIWGGDPDEEFRSAEGPGMKADVIVGGTSYGTMTQNLFPGALFDSIEDGDSDHNATLIDGNVHSVRGMTTGIKEVSDTDGAVGNKVRINFNANWNDAAGGAHGWLSAVDNVRLRALAPGDANADGVVDVTDLLALLGGQKFNQGVDGVTWEQGDFNADDQFNTGDLLAMLSFLSGTFPSDPYASEAGGASDAVADIIVNSETGEVTVDLAGHTVSAVIIESASEIFNGSQPQWDTTSQFPSTLPGELGNVLFTSTASGVDELGAVISAEFLGRDKEFYLQDLDLNILIASEGGALTKGNVIVVPEPSTWMLLSLASVLGIIVGWRQGAQQRRLAREETTE